MKKLKETNLSNTFIQLVFNSLVVGFISWFYPALSSAQETSSTTVLDRASTQNELQGFSLKMSYSGYQSNPTEAQTTSFEAQYLMQSIGVHSAQKVHFIFGLYPEQNSNYVAAPELYYSNGSRLKDYPADVEYTIGRRQTVQNKLDDVFNLGLVNPYFSQDFINYTAQGLTGLHLKTSLDYFTVGANFYPIFIPNQGPAHLEKKGKLVGVNRWAQSAPKSFVYNNKENNIDYRIANYNLYDLMGHSGYSFTLKTGDLEKTKGELNVTFSDTPINEVVISRTVIADLNLNGSVEIFPVIRYSKKVTSDFQFKQHNTTFFASYLMDTPENKLESDDHAVQMLEPIYGYGGGFQVDMTDFVDRELSFGLAYGKFYGGEIKDMNSDGQENTFSISNNRLLFQNPFKLSAELEGFKVRSLPVYFKANWIYDTQQNGSLLSLSARHSPLPQLNLSLGIDLIGVVDETKSPDRKSSFLSQHSADDRMTGALTYVF